MIKEILDAYKKANQYKIVVYHVSDKCTWNDPGEICFGFCIYDTEDYTRILQYLRREQVGGKQYISHKQDSYNIEDLMRIFINAKTIDASERDLIIKCFGSDHCGYTPLDSVGNLAFKTKT